MSGEKSRGERQDLDLTQAGQLIEFLMGKKDEDGTPGMLGGLSFLGNFPGFLAGRGGRMKEMQEMAKEGPVADTLKEMKRLQVERTDFKEREEGYTHLELIEAAKRGEAPEDMDTHLQERGYRDYVHYLDITVAKFDAKITLLAIEVLEYLVDQGFEISKISISPDWRQRADSVKKIGVEKLLEVLDREAERLERLEIN